MIPKVSTNQKTTPFSNTDLGDSSNVRSGEPLSIETASIPGWIEQNPNETPEFPGVSFLLYRREEGPWSRRSIETQSSSQSPGIFCPLQIQRPVL